MARSLEELRASIDEVDRRIGELLTERVRLVLEVGEFKRTRSLEVYDPSRERDLLDRLAQSVDSPLQPVMARRIFETIVKECRKLEEARVSGAPDP